MLEWLFGRDSANAKPSLAQVKWRHYCNCDHGHRKAYEQAGKDVGIACLVGRPDSRGIPSCMSGVYVDATASPDKLAEFCEASFRRRAEWENNPFK